MTRTEEIWMLVKNVAMISEVIVLMAVIMVYLAK